VRSTMGAPEGPEVSAPRSVAANAFPGPSQTILLEETPMRPQRKSLVGTVLVALIAPGLAVVSAGSIPTHAAAAGPGPTGDLIIQIPLRWCALEGTTAVVNPGALGEATTDQVLLRRQQRASDQIWLPGASITFRSALTAAGIGSAGFPIIDDPRPPPGSGPAAPVENPPGPGPGQVGDILFPGSPATAAEFEEARSECEEEWDHLATAVQTPLRGPIALNLGRFVDANGNPVATLGLGLPPSAWSSGPPTGPVPPWCQNPPSSSITAAEGAFMGVVDFAAVIGSGGAPDAVLDAQVVGHELGHVLQLGHGNGLDDDADATYDGFCDPGSQAAGGEDGLNAPPTIMFPSTGGITANVTTLQRGTSRGIARVSPGSQLDPPAELVNGDTLGDFRADSSQDVPSASGDMTGVGLTVNATQGRLILSHHLYGLAPSAGVGEYLAFLDLDADPTTGGPPADLGFETGFEGAELVTRVLVEGNSATPTIWRFNDERFVSVSDASVTATVASPQGEEIPFPVSGLVATQIPADVVGTVSERVRLQARSSVGAGEKADTLPGEEDGPISGGDSVLLFMTPPDFPVCSAAPELVRPGDAVKIEAAGFDRAGLASIFLGGQSIADMQLDETGSASVDVSIPSDARTGGRLITVELANAPLTADCAVQVRG
jgi:hypothetical protein